MSVKTRLARQAGNSTDKPVESSGSSGTSPRSYNRTESEGHVAKRFEIEVELNERLVNDKVVQAIAERRDIFDFNGRLAMVGEHADGQKVIRRLAGPTIRELITETVRFVTYDRDPRDGSEKAVSKRIPRWCYEALEKRGHWDGVPTIRGVVRCPVLRCDGTILQSAGFDAATGLYLDLRVDFPAIPERPSEDDVGDAMKQLLEVVGDFPFAKSAHKSAWLASVLTPLAREAHDGVTGPLFLCDSNVRGCGKTLLADLASIIVTGCEATRMTAPSRDDELRKRISSLVDVGERVVLIDNLAGRFGSPSIDAALTGTVWKDRRLGTQELIDAPLRMTWFASGNNTVLHADTARRVCHIRLESPEENPEDRSGFRHPNIREHVRKNRPQLLGAALTVLRGFIAAGKPDQKLKPWGSFESWSDLVRSAVVFAGLDDPGETRSEVRLTSDSEAGALRQILNAIAEIDPDSHGLPARQMVKIAKGGLGGYGNDAVEILREAIEEICETSLRDVSSRKLGVRLSRFRNRVINDCCLDLRTSRGSKFWFVRGGGSGGNGVSAGAVLAHSDSQSGDCGGCGGSAGAVLAHSDDEPFPEDGANTATTDTTATTDGTDWAATVFQ